MDGSWMLGLGSVARVYVVPFFFGVGGQETGQAMEKEEYVVYQTSSYVIKMWVSRDMGSTDHEQYRPGANARRRPRPFSWDKQFVDWGEGTGFVVERPAKWGGSVSPERSELLGTGVLQDGSLVTKRGTCVLPYKGQGGTFGLVTSSSHQSGD